MEGYPEHTGSAMSVRLWMTMVELHREFERFRDHRDPFASLSLDKAYEQYRRLLEAEFISDPMRELSRDGVRDRRRKDRPFDVTGSPKRARMMQPDIGRLFRNVLLNDDDEAGPVPVSAAIVVREVYTAVGGDLEPIKLQKLLYFSNVICAVVFEEPLISTDFEAWAYGPVEPAVYSEYTGRDPLPYKPREGLPPASSLCKACVRWAVAAHKGDSPHVIRQKSHTKPWRDARDPQNMHVPIPFESIKDYYSVAENFIPEVLPIIVEEVSSEASQEKKTDLFEKLLLKLARSIAHCDTLYVLDRIDLSPAVARGIHPNVVVWPGQNPWAALKVAVTQPYGLYDVFYTPLEGRTAESLTQLAKLAGLGDWIAQARLADNINAINVPYKLPEVDDTSWTKSPREKYALGSYLFLKGNDGAAVKLWEECDPLLEAIIARASMSDDPNTEFSSVVLASDPRHRFRADIYSAYFRDKHDEIASLIKKVGAELTRPLWNEAQYLLAMATRSTDRKLAQATLFGLVQEGSEEACVALFIEFSDCECSEKDLKLFADATQRGRLALGNWYAEQDKIEEAHEAYGKMDVIYQNKLAGKFRSDDVDQKLGGFYEELTYIADT